MYFYSLLDVFPDDLTLNELQFDSVTSSGWNLTAVTWLTDYLEWFAVLNELIN